MAFATGLVIAASGMSAESERLRIIAENMANINTTGSTPGSDPYQRREVIFKDYVNAQDIPMVRVSRVILDKSPFPMSYDPGNPAANAEGYVKLPNVNAFVEMMDMRQAERSYTADLTVMQASRNMLYQTLSILSEA